MRTLVLIAMPLFAAALALAACGKDDQADTGRNAGAGLTAENIVANDITAIDAVTADAANMAADINYDDALADLNNNGAEPTASGTKSSRSPARPKPRSAPSPRPAPTPADGPAEAANTAE